MSGNLFFMKNTVIGVVVILVLIIGGIFLLNTEKAIAPMPTQSGADILGENSSILLYKIGENFTDYGFFSYTFTANTEGAWYAQGFMDLNNDGVFSDDEWVIKNGVARVIKNFPNRFSFNLPKALTAVDTESIPVKIALTKNKVSGAGEIAETDTIVTTASVETYELVSEFGMDVSGANEDLKRGIGATITYAEDFEETGIDDSSLPDLGGGPMDCFAIATANNLINMAMQNGRRDDLPEDPAELISELKDFMQWDNGIIGPNFLTGKSDYINVLGLPITTEEIKRPTIEDLADAFANGDAVEVSLTMIRSASGRANTGHVLTGVSAYQDGDDAGLAAHDPATPDGTDTLDISMSGGDNPFILLEYPMWDGIVFIDTIYVQTWNGTGTTGTGESSTSLGAEDIENSVGLNFEGVGIEGSFAHVKPGEYSEVYAVATGLTPGDEITGRLHGGQHTGTPQVIVVDDNGVAYFTWRISQFGTYEVNLEDIDKSVTVIVN